MEWDGIGNIDKGRPRWMGGLIRGRGTTVMRVGQASHFTHARQFRGQGASRMMHVLWAKRRRASYTVCAQTA